MFNTLPGTKMFAGALFYLGISADVALSMLQSLLTLERILYSDIVPITMFPYYILIHT